MAIRILATWIVVLIFVNLCNLIICSIVRNMDQEIPASQWIDCTLEQPQPWQYHSQPAYHNYRNDIAAIFYTTVAPLLLTARVPYVYTIHQMIEFHRRQKLQNYYERYFMNKNNNNYYTTVPAMRPTNPTTQSSYFTYTIETLPKTSVSTHNNDITTFTSYTTKVTSASEIFHAPYLSPHEEKVTTNKPNTAISLNTHINTVSSLPSKLVELFHNISNYHKAQNSKTGFEREEPTSKSTLNRSYVYSTSTANVGDWDKITIPVDPRSDDKESTTVATTIYSYNSLSEDHELKNIDDGFNDRFGGSQILENDNILINHINSTTETNNNTYKIVSNTNLNNILFKPTNNVYVAPINDTNESVDDEYFLVKEKGLNGIDLNRENERKHDRNIDEIILENTSTTSSMSIINYGLYGNNEEKNIAENNPDLSPGIKLKNLPFVTCDTSETNLFQTEPTISTLNSYTINQQYDDSSSWETKSNDLVEYIPLTPRSINEKPLISSSKSKTIWQTMGNSENFLESQIIKFRVDNHTESGNIDVSSREDTKDSPHSESYQIANMISNYDKDNFVIFGNNNNNGQPLDKVINSSRPVQISSFIPPNAHEINTNYANITNSEENYVMSSVITYDNGESATEIGSETSMYGLDISTTLPFNNVVNISGYAGHRYNYIKGNIHSKPNYINPDLKLVNESLEKVNLFVPLPSNDAFNRGDSDDMNKDTEGEKLTAEGSAYSRTDLNDFTTAYADSIYILTTMPSNISQEIIDKELKSEIRIRTNLEENITTTPDCTYSETITGDLAEIRQLNMDQNVPPSLNIDLECEEKNIEIVISTTLLSNIDDDKEIKHISEEKKTGELLTLTADVTEYVTVSTTASDIADTTYKYGAKNHSTNIDENVILINKIKYAESVSKSGKGKKNSKSIFIFPTLALKEPSKINYKEYVENEGIDIEEIEPEFINTESSMNIVNGTTLNDATSTISYDFYYATETDSMLSDLSKFTDLEKINSETQDNGSLFVDLLAGKIVNYDKTNTDIDLDNDYATETGRTTFTESDKSLNELYEQFLRKNLTAGAKIMK